MAKINFIKKAKFFKAEDKLFLCCLSRAFFGNSVKILNQLNRLNETCLSSPKLKLKLFQNVLVMDFNVLFT